MALLCEIFEIISENIIDNGGMFVYTINNSDIMTKLGGTNMKNTYAYLCLFGSFAIMARVILNLFNIVETTGSQSSGILLAASALILVVLISEKKKTNLVNAIKISSIIMLAAGMIVSFAPHNEILDIVALVLVFANIAFSVFLLSQGSREKRKGKVIYE